MAYTPLCMFLHIIPLLVIFVHELSLLSFYKIMHINNDFQKLIIASIHIVSDLRNADQERQAILRDLVSDVEYAESELGHKNTVILGDFNSNPFDKCIINADSLYGIPYKEEIAKHDGKRQINYKQYEMFYNPMWRFYGSEKPPYGTYHYKECGLTCYYWHMFDQVLIRPSLISKVADEGISIITKTEKYSLIDDECKPNKNISDHLPILISIKED